MLLPEKFIERIKKDLGSDATPFLDSLETVSPVSIRFNNSKFVVDLFKDSVKEEVLWCDHAFYLDHRPSFTMDPLFHAGCYYSQEASSMYLWTILNFIKPNLPESPTVLDLCAAPGGKSTLLATFLNNQGLLVANEVIQARSQVLKDNLTKWGYSNQIITNSDPKTLGKLTHLFDLLVIDAPCSGEGLFRKDKKARDEDRKSVV